MKKSLVLLLFPMLCLGGEAVSERLDWMLGCWSTPDGKSIEVWAAENEHTLVGFAVSIRDNRVAFYEVLTISAGENDTLVYTARPSNQPAAKFVASDVEDQAVVFKNPAHDYPQQISYRRIGNRLDASIALLGGHNANSFDKIACDSVEDQ